MTSIASLHIYPLKGGRGLSLDQVELDHFGPRDDRRWMVIEPDGTFITQREIPTLCQVGAVPSSGAVTFSAPNVQPLTVPRPEAGSPTRQVTIWDDQTDGVDLGQTAAQWISQVLGTSLRLVYIPDDGLRRTDPEYDPIGARVSFADGYPILAISEASLDDLNRRLEAPLPMNRFRPNLVIRGSSAFAEDHWRAFSVSGVRFEGLKLCARCPVTATDQDTGARGKEPLRALAGFRKRTKGVMFGMNVAHRGRGTIKVGDLITVEQAGTAPNDLLVDPRFVPPGDAR
ncbi:MAG: MOSC domain-containing protein [Gemmatimonadales bacterium]